VISTLKEFSPNPFHYSHIVDHVKRLRTIWQKFHVSWFHARQQKTNYCGIYFVKKNRKFSFQFKIGWSPGWVSSSLWWSKFFSKVHILDIDKNKSTERSLVYSELFYLAIVISFLICSGSESEDTLDFEELLQNCQWGC
jgi:hypothetical protein